MLESNDKVGRRARRICYRPRASMKAQAIVDFLTEMTDEETTSTWVVATPNTNPTRLCLTQQRNDLQIPWTMYVDGALSHDGLGVGIILISLNEDRLTYTLCFDFKFLNNEAEYEALLVGLQIALEVGV